MVAGGERLNRPEKRGFGWNMYLRQRGMARACRAISKTIRLIRDDKGLISESLEGAGHERMHLVTFIRIGRPSRAERVLIMVRSDAARHRDSNHRFANEIMGRALGLGVPLVSHVCQPAPV